MLKIIAVASLLAGAGLYAADVERGKYLVNQVAKCSECHTPAGADGQPDTSKLLKGGPLSFQPMKEMKGWHAQAPDLTGGSRLFERWGEEGMIKFLTTGKNPRGNPAGPPMPTYTMKAEDAADIVAYLKSLK